MKRLICRSFSATRSDRLVWTLDSKRLRILCYHGVCRDGLAEEPWVPRYFVTASTFKSHLQYLQRNATVLPLSEAAARLRDGSLPPRSVSITFDDGYANNLELAGPLLEQYQLPATIFLSSAYMESGEFFPFLKLPLIRLLARDAGISLTAGPLLEYKSAPLDRVVESADRWWPALKARITDAQREALRPLTVDEVRNAESRLIEFGAHSHTHCILKNESGERRQEEVRTSIRKVAQWTGQPVRLFSYPNGQRGDFGEIDKVALRAEGIQAAVSGIGGANGRRADFLELKRYPVGMYHDDAGFRAEVTGFRSALLTATGRVA